MMYNLKQLSSGLDARSTQTNKEGTYYNPIEPRKQALALRFAHFRSDWTVDKVVLMVKVGTRHCV